MRVLKLGCAVLFVNVVLIGNVLADASSANLKTQLDALKGQVEKLESQLSTLNSDKKTETAESKGPLDKLQVSGMVDSIYSYNFNSPTTSSNVGRVFDNDSDSINLNAAKLTFQKAVSSDSPVGFRTDLLAGDDAKLIHSAGLGESGDSFDLEQAYVEMNLGASKLSDGMNDLNLKVGEFVTLAGAEVIESKDNWNTSRSLLFGYAIPFTHTGARLTYTFDNGWDAAVGINNGWDVTDDNNDGKTIETHLGFNGLKLPWESSVNVALQGYFGPEGADDNSSDRNLGDVVITYKTPWKPLTVIYNFDYASQDNLDTDGGSADWYGHAGYFKVDLADDWSIAGRGEYFHDSDGVRIVSGTGANYREFTATLEYRPWEGVITRLEYRNDHASEDVYNDSDSETTDTQDTLSGEVIYSF